MTQLSKNGMPALPMPVHSYDPETGEEIESNALSIAGEMGANGADVLAKPSDKRPADMQEDLTLVESAKLNKLIWKVPSN